MKTTCSWCSEQLRPADSYAGSGPDLLCSNECATLYWRDMDRVEADLRWMDRQPLWDDTDFFED